MKDGSRWGLIPGMLFRPRKTITLIVDGEHYEWVLAIAAIVGAGFALLEVATWHLGQPFGLWVVLIGSLAAGGLYGVLSLYAGGWAIAVCGRWVGAKGGLDAVRAALAWGSTPSLVAYLIVLVQLVIFGDRAFSANVGFPRHDLISLLAIVLLKMGFLVFSVWSFVTTIAALSQVQRLSVARTVGNLLFAQLVLALPLIAIFVLVMSALHS